MPPPLATHTAVVVFLDQSNVGELAEVVAGGPRIGAEPLGKPIESPPEAVGVEHAEALDVLELPDVFARDLSPLEQGQPPVVAHERPALAIRGRLGRDLHCEIDLLLVHESEHAGVDRRSEVIGVADEGPAVAEPQ